MDKCFERNSHKKLKKYINGKKGTREDETREPVGRREGGRPEGFRNTSGTHIQSFVRLTILHYNTNRLQFEEQTATIHQPTELSRALRRLRCNTKPGQFHGLVDCCSLRCFITRINADHIHKVSFS